MERLKLCVRARAPFACRGSERGHQFGVTRAGTQGFACPRSPLGSASFARAGFLFDRCGEGSPKARPVRVPRRRAVVSATARMIRELGGTFQCRRDIASDRI